MRIPADTVIDSRYRIIEHLGSGGMAEVYCATDLQLGRKVALKMLHDRFAQDPEFVERFKREASAAAGLQHQHIVAVYDRGDWDGGSYIAMEYVAGRTLKQLVHDSDPPHALPPAAAVDLTVQILRATRFAHRRGVIHRDLKPHNVIVDEEGRAKVTDFGIARAGASDMTQTGSIMGTAQYLSPEQAQGHAVTAASDLYAIGIVLYELLTGRVPFEAESAVTIAVKQVNEAPVPPSRINPEVTPELESVVLKAMQKNPAARFADADEFIAALQDAASRIPSPAAIAAAEAAAAAALPGLDIGAAPPPPVGPVTGVYPGLEIYDPRSELGPPPAPPPRRRWRWPWALLAAVLGALVLIAVLLLAAPQRVQVPGVVGSSISAAQQRLEKAGFDVTSVRSNSTRPQNQVIGQNPRGGSTVDEGSRVTLNVSDGPRIGTVPEVVGLGRREATKVLLDAGYRVKQTRQFSADVNLNHVIAQSPSARSAAEAGAVIELTISKGPEKVAVPDVVGRSEDDARAALGQAGFTVSVRRKESATENPGTVLAQDPRAGAPAPSGSSVTLTVARQPKTIKVPDVTGRTQNAATKVLSARGFEVDVRDTPVDTQDQDGIVLDQSPTGGSKKQRGSTVEITVGTFDPNLNPGNPTTTTTTPSAPAPPPPPPP